MFESVSLLEIIVKIGSSFIIGLVLGEIMHRCYKRFAPDFIKKYAKKVKMWYLYPFRWLTPDWVYKLYLREGQMDKETYRKFQEKNFIRDDLDPEYIVKNVSNDK